MNDGQRHVSRGDSGGGRADLYLHHDSQEALLAAHSQIGVDDPYGTGPRGGKPVFRGLIGPMPEGQNVVRYESPEVFETLTKDWRTREARSPPLSHDIADGLAAAATINNKLIRVIFVCPFIAAL